jgi:hypothetical protein
MVTGPGWIGTRPDGIKKVFPSETQFSLAVIRTQLFNPNDMDNVKKIQAGYKVQTLSEFTHQPPPASLPAPDFPAFTEDAFKLQFPAYLNFLLQFCPTLPEETALRARFATVGIEAGKPFDLAKLSDVQKGELALAVKEGYEAIEKQKDSIGKDINGWNVGAAFGNRAFYNGNYLLRAGSALAGIYGNDAIEAMYPQAKAASDGQPLDGSKHNYTLTFAAGQFPPVNAFWSVTMYDGKTQLLIKNSINRYLINSPMLPILKKNADGSLTLYIQKDVPAVTRKPTGSRLRTVRFTWSCDCTGQRRSRLQFCLPARVRGNRQPSRSPNKRARFHHDIVPISRLSNNNRISVENRDYHHLSHSEIGGGKRISQHLSDFLHEID